MSTSVQFAKTLQINYLERNMKTLKKSLVMWFLLTIVMGLIYPLAMTGVGQLIFHHAANGSIIESSGKKMGSELIGQEFTNPGYFWSRRSTTGGMPYNATASTGSNQGPLNPALYDAVKGRVETLQKADPNQAGSVPIDLVTASGSGLDPHITPSAAEFQIQRVAAVRGISADDLRKVVSKQIEGRQFGLLGEATLNILKVNLLLDKLYPLPKRVIPNAG